MVALTDSAHKLSPYCLAYYRWGLLRPVKERAARFADRTREQYTLTLRNDLGCFGLQTAAYNTKSPNHVTARLRPVLTPFPHKS